MRQIQVQLKISNKAIYLMKMYLHKGPYIQRGRGFGSIFSSVVNRVLPALRVFKNQVARSPLMQELGASLRDNAVHGVKQLAADVLAGRNVKKHIKENIGKARNDILRTIEDSNQQQEAAVATATKRKRLPAKRRIPIKRIRKSVFQDLSDSEEVPSEDDDGGSDGGGGGDTETVG